MRAQSKSTKARRNAVALENERQRGIEHSSRALFDQNVGDFDNANPKIEEIGKTLGEEFVNVQRSPDEAPVGTNFVREAPEIVGRFADQQAEEAFDFTSQQGLARGKMNSLAELILSNGLRNTERSSKIDANSAIARGSLNVLPLELQAANSKASSPLGDLLVGVGSVGLGQGLSLDEPLLRKRPSGSVAGALKDSNPTTGSGRILSSFY